MIRKFLIIQLGHFGDCLYATSIARQIKYDFPHSYITWAIAPRYKSILNFNPDIDYVWEVQPREGHHRDPDWNLFLSDVKERKNLGDFDEIIFSQILPLNLSKCTGTIRGSILNSYKRPITISVKPVLYLSQNEIENVKNFALRNRLSDFNKIVLFECAATSNQTDINIHFALRVAEYMTKMNLNLLFILSSPTPLDSTNPQIIDASELSFRENAELINYCDLLIGCSSGITWLSTSIWSRSIPTIQFLKKEYLMYQGLKYDHELWNLHSNGIVEMVDFSEQDAINCIETALDDFKLCAKKYHQDFKVSYYHFSAIINMLLEDYKLFKIFQSWQTFSRHNSHLKKSKLLGIIVKCSLLFLLKKSFSSVKKLKKLKVLAK